MAGYRGWVDGRGGAGGWSGWEAGGGLHPVLGLFGPDIVPEVPAIGSNMLEWRNRHLPITGVNFRPIYAFHVVAPLSQS